MIIDQKGQGASFEEREGGFLKTPYRKSQQRFLISVRVDMANASDWARYQSQWWIEVKMLGTTGKMCWQR